MKLSVYIPDDLYEEAKKVDPDLKPSAIIQDVLRSRVGERRFRPYRQLTPELESELESTRARVLDRVAEAYRVGYEVGLAFAPNLPWRAFENFAATNWDVRGWREAFDVEEYDYLDASDEEKAHGLVVLDYEASLGAAIEEAGGYFPVDDRMVPVGIASEGFVDAIRDVWTGASGRAKDAASVLPTPRDSPGHEEKA